MKISYTILVRLAVLSLLISLTELTSISQDKKNAGAINENIRFDYNNIELINTQQDVGKTLTKLPDKKFLRNMEVLPPPFLLADFEEGNFPPTGWTILTLGYPNYWSRANVSGYMIGNGSAKFDFWNAPQAVNNVLRSPVFPQPLTNQDSIIFDCTKAFYDMNHRDTVYLNYSTNGGSSWWELMTWLDPSSLCVTTNSGSPYIPTTSSQWRTIRIRNQFGPVNRIQFVTCSAHGNNLYIDNVRINTIISIPSPPTLISPTNNATNVSLTPTLDWSDVSGATSYRVQVSQNSSFSTTVVNQTSSSSQYTIPTGILSPTTTYYWRANATNSAGTSNWSSVFIFTTTTGPPPPPTLLSPPNGASNVSLTPTLDWSDVSGATSYAVQVSLNSGFSSTVVNQSGLSSSQYTISTRLLNGEPNTFGGQMLQAQAAQVPGQARSILLQFHRYLIKGSSSMSKGLILIQIIL
jgi:hypothetical protein